MRGQGDSLWASQNAFYIRLLSRLGNVADLSITQKQGVRQNEKRKQHVPNERTIKSKWL